MDTLPDHHIDKNALLLFEQADALMAGEIQRRKHATGQKTVHPTQPLLINGSHCHIDQEIAPVIRWFKSLGILTQWSCQGEIRVLPRDHGLQWPYVIWLCSDYEKVLFVINKLMAFEEHNMIMDIIHPFHQIETVVDSFEGMLRYNTKWFDLLALQDFIQWAKL